MRRLSDGGEAEKSEDVERYSTVDMITYCEIKEQSMSSQYCDRGTGSRCVQ